MKKISIILITTLALISSANSQTNTFPASGNVGVVDSSPSAALSVHGYTPPVGGIWGGGDTMLFHNAGEKRGQSNTLVISDLTQESTSMQYCIECYLISYKLKSLLLLL